MQVLYMLILNKDIELNRPGAKGVRLSSTKKKQKAEGDEVRRLSIGLVNIICWSFMLTIAGGERRWEPNP